MALDDIHEMCPSTQTPPCYGGVKAPLNVPWKCEVRMKHAVDKILSELTCAYCRSSRSRLAQPDTCRKAEGDFPFIFQGDRRRLFWGMRSRRRRVGGGGRGGAAKGDSEIREGHRASLKCR